MPLNPKFQKLLDTDFDNMYSLGVDKLREWYGKSWDDFKGDVLEVGTVVNRVVKTSKRDTPIRVYYSEVKGIHPVFIWIHGGGFVLGNIEVYDSICRKIANNVNCTVISIDYGLSPEHKFPEPVEECYQVVKWIFENAKELNINSDKIAIGGDSVGGTLSAVICQLSRERKEFSITYQVIINAMLDLLGQTKPKSRVENAKGYRLTTKGIEWFVQQYLRNLSEAKNPLASPLLADNFEGLPAACIITSEYDPLRDEGEHYAQRLSESGIEVCLKRYDGIIHGFFNMQRTLEEARDALDLVCTKLSEVFSK
ncbi:alpha/beta hydrolase [Clostridium pasteurianum]|uniref:Esterase/lipase n=1 Tax=Clostridium pasteurianum BC1 TaxID=86416 RepID=R4K3R1_CLOPA|nr:alpha/beta hydrolase [Clostridium pasteurianum]AGK96356.1 esterase/lipase [Clostridium pasteurianum BC1]